MLKALLWVGFLIPACGGDSTPDREVGSDATTDDTSASDTSV